MARAPRPLVAIAALASTLCAAGVDPCVAHADGAFPDSMALFLPADRPLELVLATNFGLVISDDGGTNWSLVCEQAIASYVGRYQMSAAPADTLFADTAVGLAYSIDDGCSWQQATGQVAGLNILDTFPDPADAAHVFVISRTFSDDGAHDHVVESRDGGRSFPAAPLFTAASMTTVTGVEIARTDPRPLYLTMFTFPPLIPTIARSSGGAPFETIDQSGAIALTPYLAAVDAKVPTTLYLRLRGTSDALAISRDGGSSIAETVPMAGTMSAFLQRSDGTILVGSSDGPSLRSSDGAATFAPWPGAPHLRALAERDGVLFAAGDDLRDSFAVARSDDGGAHWTPLLHFADITGPRACGTLPATCAQAWQTVRQRFAPADGGMASPSDGGMAPATDSRPRPGGCGCSIGAGSDRRTAAAAIALAVIVLAALAARARRQA